GTRDARWAARHEPRLPGHLRARTARAPVRGRGRGPRGRGPGSLGGGIVSCVCAALQQIRFGTNSARTRTSFFDSVDAGWRVAAVPTRVGTRARVHEKE